MTLIFKLIVKFLEFKIAENIHHNSFTRYHVTMSNFNFSNVKFPNAEMPNVIFVEQTFCQCFIMWNVLLCRWLTLQNTYFVNVLKCSHAKLQISNVQCRMSNGSNFRTFD
jgi:hypothetical protein